MTAPAPTTTSPEFSGSDYHQLSFWHDTVGESLEPRPRLERSIEVDVAVVGGGFTGLWTAYYLAKADPSLRIAVLEKHIAGFGASGRNGGNISGARYAMGIDRLAKESGRDAALAQYRAMDMAFHSIESVVAENDIDCDWVSSGSLAMARTALQLETAQADVRNRRAWGFGEDDVQLLSQFEMRSRIGATDVLGGTYSPKGATAHPAKLARGLARLVESLGVTIYEQTPATSIAGGVVETPGGTVRAEVAVRALEGYTAMLKDHKRVLTPLYSMMLATEPLSEDFWSRAGLHHRESFGDFRHLIVYGQRTADNRFAFGGRGAPYHFRSSVRREYETKQDFFPQLRASLVELFPEVADAKITHTWGGVFASSRDWHPSAGYDRGQRLAWAGGYAGGGVTAANLAGQTLADLITGKNTELTTLPWTNHNSPKWEIEPARWIGINASLHAMAGVDRKEARTGRPTKRARLIGRLMGH